MSARLLVLAWHNIDPTPAFPLFGADERDAARRAFTRQLSVLRRIATVVRLDDALGRMRAGAALPPRAVALTFDDGYRDNADVALPALARAGLPATFFLVPGFLSGHADAWWEDLADGVLRAGVDRLDWDGHRYDLGDPASRRRAEQRLAGSLKNLTHDQRVATVARLRERLAAPVVSHRPRFMDWSGARRLVASGHDVGSHTRAHAILARESEADQAVDLAASRRELEAGLDRPVTLLAYPNGRADDYDATTRALARRSGYRAAVTTRAGLATAADPPFEVPRVVVDPTHGPSALTRALARRVRAALPRGR